MDNGFRFEEIRIAVTGEDRNQRNKLTSAETQK